MDCWIICFGKVSNSEAECTLIQSWFWLGLDTIVAILERVPSSLNVWWFLGKFTG